MLHSYFNAVNVAFLNFPNTFSLFFRSGTSLGGINENEELQTRPMSAMPGMNLEENDGKHYWLKCMFKNPTFCLVCGKIVSVLGSVLTSFKQSKCYNALNL